MAEKATDLPKRYDPQEIEGKWYKYWEDHGYFRAEIGEDGEPFSIVIPPPNVTGSLHVGHALNNTLQDILIRFRRMQGYDTLWLPGTDHAGIATQVVVERELAKEGKTRYDLGRKKFLERVWKWREEYGGQILHQLERLGASCDWSRERFTMDEGCSRAVREVFVRLYEKGLIYRGDYIINWCPRCSTSLSDLEVEHEDTAGELTFVRYPFADGNGEVVVATTRPETMLGDTAVAVHPDDPRYKDVVGKKVILPVMEREIPIVADSYVDPEFGTGAVKVTPAHDPNDFEIGLRHNLEAITVIGEDGKMTEAAGKYAGMDRYECRKQLVEELKQGGYFLKTEAHGHSVGHCQRCGTVIEPLISKQWFVKMKPLAEPAIKVVQEGKIRFVPERFAKIYLHWMENIRDWCISRQIWWGHRIPAWYCECGEVIVAREDPDTCPKCGSKNLKQDPDVLDTWFSSALWPFSTMGWPDRTPELEHFFPTSVLVTAYDIIFFWVARMIFSSLEHMGEIPFRDVFINGLVRDANGQKMSKSKGTGMDPLEIIDEYGADTLRFSLVNGTTPGNDMRYYPEKVAAARNFLIKVWNASRFALMNLEGFSACDIELDGELELSDRWILSRFNQTVKKVTGYLEEYQLGEATRVLYDFIWSELCDWYIELIKPRLYGEDEAAKKTAQSVLSYVLEGTMRLFHPFVPFLTEEIWQRLPHTGETVMLASWPKYQDEQVDGEAVSEMELLMEVIRGIRNIRGEMNVPPGKKAKVIAVTKSAEVADTLEKGLPYIRLLAQADEVEITHDLSERPKKAATAVVSGAEIYVPLAELIDLTTEIRRLEKELKEVEAELVRAEKKLSNEGFVQKAPAEIVEKERAKRDDYRERKLRLKERLAQLA